MRSPFSTVRGRLTTWTAIVVGIVTIVGALVLYGVARGTLVSDVRDTLTDNLTEARAVLDRGVATELNLLALGVATDPLDQTSRLADERCAPILAEAYGDSALPFDDFYFLLSIDDAAYVAYDDCLRSVDPLYEAALGCDEAAIDQLGNPVVTFDQYWELYSGGEFETLRDACFDATMEVNTQVDEAAAVCDALIETAFDGVDVLDETAVASATDSVLGAYSDCMRANGIPDYPDLSSSPTSDGSVLSGAAGSTVVIPSLEAVRSGLGRFGRGMAIGVPLLLLLLALLTWVVVGGALAPVEAIRTHVAAIGAQDLHRRVPLPDTDDEVARLAGTMNSMLDRIERSTERQRQFVSDASHELRSPLASIRAQVEVALRHPESARWDDVGTGVLAESARMERLVDDLLILARLDEGAGPLHRERLSIAELAEEEAARRGGSVPVGVAISDAGETDGDPHSLRRVIRNLLDNAARHAESQVTISVSVVGGRIEVAVDDDGSGISPADRDRIFERFTRLEEARSRDDGGSGLGLAVVREVVTAHTGTIRVEDSALGGARFVVSLPRGGTTQVPSATA